jgi:hypothetical protein
MNKKVTLIAIIALIGILILSAPSLSQVANSKGQVSFGKAQTSTDGHTDSTSFREFYYFDVPEGAQRDSCQLHFWCYSEDGAAHLIVRFWAALKLGNEKNTTSYKVSPDSTTLSADWSTESAFVGWRVEPAAKDTTENGTDTLTGTNLWPDAYRVLVGGYTANRADTKYFLKMVAVKPD